MSTVTAVSHIRKLCRTSVRTRIVWLIILDYILLILEGAIRKWVFPQFAEVLFFIRVPVTLWLYIFVLKYGLWPRPHKFLIYGIGFALFGLLLMPVQMLFGGYDSRYLLLAGYGWLNYFFYIPLAFIAAEHLRLSDFYRILKITLILAMIAAPLTVLQLFSPAESPLVRGFGSGSLHQFTGLGFGNALVRPMGFFTSSVGEQMFTASVLAFILAAWIIPYLRAQVPALLRYGGAGAVIILIGVSMQRGTLIHSGIVVLFASIGGILTLRRRILLKSSIYPYALIIVGTVLFITLFPDAFDLFTMRWHGAYQSESQTFGSLGILSRIFHEMTKFLSLMYRVPVLGYLLGIAGNAAAQLPWVELPAWAQSWSGPEGWAEDGLSKNIVELGPIIGLLFILYRFAFFFWLLRNALSVARKMGDPFPMILVAFVGPLLLSLQMTGHGSIVGYAWMFIGFTMASIREARSHKIEENLRVKLARP